MCSAAYAVTNVSVLHGKVPLLCLSVHFVVTVCVCRSSCLPFQKPCFFFVHEISRFVHCFGFRWRWHNVISAQCPGCHTDRISNKRGDAAEASMKPESPNWPSLFALRGRLIQQVDIWRKDKWSTCKSFVFNIFGSRDLLAPYLFLFLGRCRLIRSLHSVRSWCVGHVIDRNRCGLCHPVVRQLLVVFCPLALRARQGPEHLELSFWHCVAFSRVSTLQVISSSLC